MADKFDKDSVYPPGSWIAKKFVDPYPPNAENNYYETPADKDLLFKFRVCSSLVTPFAAGFALQNIYGYWAGRTKLTPSLVAWRFGYYIIPVNVAAMAFVSANAAMATFRGKDTPWNHFWGGFFFVSTLAGFVRQPHYCFGLGVLAGLGAVVNKYDYDEGQRTTGSMFNKRWRLTRAGANHFLFRPIQYSVLPDTPDTDEVDSYNY